MDIDGQTLLRFLNPQIRDYGANVEIDSGLWALFAIAAADEVDNPFAAMLLREASFAWHSGLSADDQWMLYYVDDANRAAAIHWLDDLTKTAAGEIRPVSPAQRALISELPATARPHRVAQQLAEFAARAEITAGAIRQPAVVRGCLDRLHQRDPLIYSAFQLLLAHHLVDMVVLLKQLIAEDVDLLNELVKGSLSRDPFQQNLQDSAVGIRSALIRFHLINPLDQQKNSGIANPYAVYMEIAGEREPLSLPLDGGTITVPRANLVAAIRSIRQNIYRGQEFSTFDTQSPWVTESIAHPFRFIKQRLDGHRELSSLAALYMLERAVET